jgi:transglutaminase-like putative cysteine protease
VKAQKIIAMVMVLSGSILVAAVFRDIAFPAILCILGLLGLQRRFTWDLRPERRFISSLLLLLLAVLFALHYQYAGLTGHLGQERASLVAWETIARYFLASMILVLFLGSRRGFPPSLGLFHMGAVISAGQVLLLDDLYMAFRLLEVFSVVLIVLYASAGLAPRAADGNAGLRNPKSGSAWPWRLPRALWSGRLAACAAMLLIAVNLGWVASSALYRHVELLNYVPVWLWHGAATIETGIDGTSYVGFSTSGELSTLLLLKGNQDTTPALRIVSAENPGYLRARAFDVYRKSRWFDVSTKDAVLPAQNAPFGTYLVGRMNLFRLGEPGRSRTREMMVRHESGIRDAIFAPLGVLSLEAPVAMLMRDDHGIVYPADARSTLVYRVAYGDWRTMPAPDGQQAARMLELSPQLNPRIRQLAETVFAGCTTTAQKIDAAVGYFRARYTYSLGLDVPPDRDKLEYFLLDSTSGYCEYFASGAAILLRLAGVPTRYVTGFLVTERDSDTDAWVARYMDAHAWAEAWDRERNEWCIVEATVQDGLATMAAKDKPREAEGIGASFLIRQFWNNLYEYGFFGVLAWALQFYGLPAVSFLVAAVVAAILCGIYRHLRPWRPPHFGSPDTPELAALHRVLARMDRRVRHAGSRRDLYETLQAFARRLRDRDGGDGLWTRFSDWYLEYASIRYDRTVTPDQLQRLRDLARKP